MQTDNFSSQTWPLHSRVHPLNGFPSDHTNCYVKRDDELSVGISGSKVRKYSSIIPHLLATGVTTLVIIAGTQSNNLLAALQVAREHGFSVKAFLLKPWGITKRGNYALSRLMLKSENIQWVSREQWPTVDVQARRDELSGVHRL